MHQDVPSYRQFFACWGGEQPEKALGLVAAIGAASYRVVRYGSVIQWRYNKAYGKMVPYRWFTAQAEDTPPFAERMA
jgi:hypothetical protein